MDAGTVGKGRCQKCHKKSPFVYKDKKIKRKICKACIIAFWKDGMENASAGKSFIKPYEESSAKEKEETLLYINAMCAIGRPEVLNAIKNCK